MPPRPKAPKISVCIFTYNHEKYISDCLASVLTQDINGEIEILVGDDHSTDSTTNIVEKFIEKFPKKIRLYKQKSNIGASRNLKFLVDKARGDFISHLDGDDYWLPGKLHSQLEEMNKNTDAIAIFNNSVVVSDNKSPVGFFNNHISEFFDIGYLLENGNFLHHSTLLYRKTAKEIIFKLPDEFIDYRIHIALAKEGKLSYINQVNSCYRIGSSSSMIAATPEKVRLLYSEAILSYGKKDYASLHAMANFWSEIILSSIMNRNIKSAISWWNYIAKIDNRRWRIFINGIIKTIKLLQQSALRKTLQPAHSPKVLFPRGKKHDHR